MLLVYNAGLLLNHAYSTLDVDRNRHSVIQQKRGLGRPDIRVIRPRDAEVDVPTLFEKLYYNSYLRKKLTLPNLIS